MKAVGYTPDARDELDAALAASSDPADFRRAVDDALRAAASGLITHARYPRSPCRQCVLNPHPYSLIYQETDAEIRVVAVAHHKRRSGYWKRRIGP